jgi:hypothetical protein
MIMRSQSHTGRKGAKAAKLKATRWQRRLGGLASLHPPATNPSAEQVAGEVAPPLAVRMRSRVAPGALGQAAMLKHPGRAHRPHLPETAMAPAREADFTERTLPGTPRSPLQKYLLTASGPASRSRLS